VTFSIAARSADGTQFGVAVASRFLAVGAAVPAAGAGATYTGDRCTPWDLHNLYFDRPDPAALLDLTGALADWAGMQNLEERLVPGRIDPVVLAQLRDATPTTGVR